MTKRTKTPYTVTRAEERTAAVISRRTLPDGTTLSTYSVDLSSAKPPDRAYYARDAWVRIDGSVVSFQFWQPMYASEGARSLISVHMPPSAVWQFVESVKGMANPSLEQISKNMEIAAEPIRALTGEPDQVVELSANLVGVAVSAYETALDFYKASPFSVLKVQAGRALDLDPQIRVDLRTSLFIGLMAAVEQLIEKLPPKSLQGREGR